MNYTYYKNLDRKCVSVYDYPPDITYSRHKHENPFCDNLSGCKCRTDLCYYGDPCLCTTKNGCGIDKTLTDSG
ncbi:Hypothetical predicted protein, partial [Mytilus galloprovincialis]